MKRIIVGLMLIFATSANAYQATVVVPNGTGAQVRTNMNNALLAATTSQSGSSVPSPTYAYMSWVDTSTTPPTLKMRNSANSAWIAVGTLNDTGPVFFATNATSCTTAGNSNNLDGYPRSYYQQSATAINTSNIGSQSVATATNTTGTGSIPYYRYETGLREIRGTINWNYSSNTWTIVRGSGFSISNWATGVVMLSFTSSFSAPPTMPMSISQSGTGVVGTFCYPTVSGANIYIINGTNGDRQIDFVAIGPN